MRGRLHWHELRDSYAHHVHVLVAHRLLFHPRDSLPSQVISVMASTACTGCASLTSQPRQLRVTASMAGWGSCATSSAVMVTQSASTVASAGVVLKQYNTLLYLRLAENLMLNDYTFQHRRLSLCSWFRGRRLLTGDTVRLQWSVVRTRHMHRRRNVRVRRRLLDRRERKLLDDGVQ